MNVKNKIGVFVYNFPHYKTQQGILNLFLHNIKIDVAFGANPVKLNFYTSKIRISPKYTNVHDTKDIMEKFNIDYYVLKHNSQETIDIIKEYDLDLGIILGARIISQGVIDAFKIGIINMHPGIIPINRGLDNIKWAVIDNIKQGATTHLISKEIDKGEIIDIQEIEVFEDDSLMDIHIRIQELEQTMMIEAINKVSSGISFAKVTEDGKYNKALDIKNENKLIKSFNNYKKSYINYCNERQ